MTRLLTAAVLILIVLGGVFGGSPWLLLVIAAIAAIAYSEYGQILRLPVAMRVLGLLAGVGLLLIPLHLVFVALLLFTLLLLLLPLDYSRKNPLADARGSNLRLSRDREGADSQAEFHNVAATSLGIIYIFGAFRTAYLLGTRSPWLLLFALALSWVGDSGAYYIGRQFGRHKLAPRISPGKSWEGAAASAVLSVLFFMAVLPRVLAVSLSLAALLGLAGNIAGQLGDLAESALKRSVGVKDSGKLLPGHGGMLDRVDSVLFTLPVTYTLILALCL